MKKILIVGTICFFSAIGFAQNKEGFSTRYQSFLKGDIIMFGNQILNRQTKQATANESYTDLGRNIKTNDDFSMEYIDVDKDKTTFSSSVASMLSPLKGKMKIAFAGLYWTAIYPYERGKIADKKFVSEDDVREPFEQVLLKLPKHKEYVPIQGKIVFDGDGNEEYMDNTPYVVFADITTLLQELKNPAGEYTVANIRAGKGHIKGGSAAGWAIVVVYEDTEQITKRIEIKDGFLLVQQQEIPITFNDFKTPNDIESIARIAGATLECDARVGENKLAVRTNTSGIYIETDKRNVDNFFNSSITEDEEYQLKRNPQSINTLGFDIFSTEIPNYENEIISVGTTSLDIDVISTKDKFYLFLLALSIDSQENIIVAKTESAQSENQSQEVAQPQLESKPEIQTESTEKEVVIEKQPTPTSAIPQDVRKATIVGVEKGFYTILGAFSTSENADKYIQKQKGLTLQKLFYSEKSMYYVYYSHSTSYNDALKKQMDFVKLKETNSAIKAMKTPWIFFVQN